MEFYSKTDIGKKRYSNQDAVVGEAVCENLVWTAVCDGMGGVSGGDVASKVATQKISQVMSRLTQNTSKEDTLKLMNDAIQNANSEVFKMSQSEKDLHGMGTTVVLAVVSGENLYVMHAGDSRAYLISRSGIKQISVDHSVVQEMVNSGEITSKEARNHLQKNIITRALGIGSLVELDYNEQKLSAGDTVLICSDGLSNHLEDKEIYSFSKKKSLEEVADTLIDKCNSRGGKDNITVSLIKI